MYFKIFDENEIHLPRYKLIIFSKIFIAITFIPKPLSTLRIHTKNKFFSFKIFHFLIQIHIHIHKQQKYLFRNTNRTLKKKKKINLFPKNAMEKLDVSRQFGYLFQRPISSRQSSRMRETCQTSALRSSTNFDHEQPSYYQARMGFVRDLEEGPRISTSPSAN